VVVEEALDAGVKVEAAAVPGADVLVFALHGKENAKLNNTALNNIFRRNRMVQK
jgi:hypothetical protein